jgi:hypothetical protein
MRKKLVRVRRRVGRPTRAETRKRTMAALKALGIDPASVDPRAILSAIAADASAPASARVTACRMLIENEKKGAPPNDGGTTPLPAAIEDEISKRAVELMGRKRRMN